MLSFRRSAAGLAAIAVSGALGAGLVLYSTAQGIGTGSDSPFYLMPAHSLLAGKGLRLAAACGDGAAPMTSFGPLLPVFLAGLGRAGIDPASGARWLNAFLFCAAIVMVGLLVRRSSGSQWAGALAAVAAAATTDALSCHCFLLSEPLFLCLVLSGIGAVMFYMERPSLALLLLFSAAFGLAAATRYAGASLLPVGAGAILFTEGPRRRRLMHAGVFAAIFGLPITLWLARNLALTGNAWGRATAFHPPGLHVLASTWADLAGWLLPAAIPGLLRLLAPAVLLAMLAAPFVARPRQAVPLHGILCGFVVSYVLVYVIAMTWVDAQAWMVRRHLLVLYMAGLAGAAVTIARVFGRLGPRGRLACAMLCVAAAGVNVARTVRWAAKSHREGLGFSSVRWQRSGMAARLRAIDARVPLVSNSVSAVYLLTGRKAAGIPLRIDPQTGLVRAEYEAESARVRAKVERQKAVIVLFAGFPDHLEQQAGLRRWAVADEGYLLSAGGEP